MKKQIILTAFILIVFTIVNFLIIASAPVVSADLSVSQLQDTNTGYAMTRVARIFDGKHAIPLFVTIALLTLIWLPVWMGRFKKTGSTTLGLAILAFAASTLNVNAYYNERNDIEQITIKSNQTAFLIPMQGANITNQAQFDSAAFLDANKVPSKRIEIPHVLLPKTGFLTKDVYIPSAQLIVVTREPFARCWTKEANRGTSSANEGFFVESKEGIDVDCGVSIAASIQLQDSALYLYNFGISDSVAPQDADHPDFASVVYAKNLSVIMDSVVRQDVQRLLAREFGKRALDDAISQKAEIMETISNEITKSYAALGITIKYIGFATPLNFDQKIQDSIDSKFIAKKNAEAAPDRMIAMPVLMGLAEVHIKEGIATAIGKWNGQLSLPSFLLVSDQLANTLGNWFGSATPHTDGKPTELKSVKP